MNKKIMIIIVGVVCVVLGVIVSTQSGPTHIFISEQEESLMPVMEAPKNVTLMRVEKKDFQDTLLATGAIEGEKSAALSFEVEGVVDRFLVQEGGIVKEGQVIAQLKNKDAVYRLQHAQAKFEEVLANVHVFESKLQGIKGLFELGGISKQKVEEAQKELVHVQKQLQVAQVEYDFSKVELEKLSLRAPMAGVIFNKQVHEGEVVNANTFVAQIANIDVAVARVGVIERDLTKLQKGQRVMLQSDAYPTESFLGITDDVPVAVTGDERIFNVKIRIANDKHHLLPGMFVHAHILFYEKLQAIALPHQSVFYDGKVFWVYRLDGVDKVIRQEVSIAHRNMSHVIIESGVLPGDYIVSSGLQHTEQESIAIVPQMELDS